MASLQAPLTIISNTGGSGIGSHSFQPPAATWFDEDVSCLHFVALEARPRNYDGDTAASAMLRESIVSGMESIDSSMLLSSGVGSKFARRGSQDGDNSSTGMDKEPASEIVRYQAFGLPRHEDEDRRRNSTNSPHLHREKDGDNKNNDSTGLQPLSAFESAQKAAQDQLKTLSIDISVAFPLPFQLATVVSNRFDPSIATEDDDTFNTGASTVAWSRRIPILAKFSPKMDNGMRYLALQYTPTMVRIAAVEGGTGRPSTPAPPVLGRRNTFAGKLPAASTAEGAGLDDVHWTIDLSVDACPVSSKPEQMPVFKEGSARNLFGKNPKAEEGIVPGTTSIIGGGVLWSTRGQADNAKTSLDMIVVTTTSVLVYYMNMAKKSLIKTHIFPHDMAASFWYEPSTRTLVIGSYKNNNLRTQSSNGADDSDRTPQQQHNQEKVYDTSFRSHSMSLRSVFSVEIEEDQSSAGSDDRGMSFPSAVMEMKALFFSKFSPSIETFPAFAVGTLREVVTSEEDERHELMLSLETFDSGKVDKMRQKEDAENAVVLPTEIFLVNLYGSVYCVELGSLGSGKGIGLTKLDREAGCIYVRQQNFDALKGCKVDVESTISVGVIDNLLCIFSKKDETTHFLDVADLFSDDQRIYRESIGHLDPEIHSETLSFLAPCYFLDTSGQGLLYEVALSLPLVLQNVPSAACIIPFLLRRNAQRVSIRAHVMERFAKLIESRDMLSLQTWIGVIVDQYSKSEDALKFDFESTVALLSKSSLVAPNDIIDGDDMAFMENIMVPASFSKVLTQTEMLQLILIWHAVSAMKKGNGSKLQFITSLSVHYFVELERRSLTPCVALQCLVISLLWRTGENAELTSFLSARQSQWAITRRRRQLDLPTATRMYFENSGAVSLAETLFTMATEDLVNKASKPCAPSTVRQLISHATIILLGCGATSIAVKCLLSAGQLNDAINICSKRLKPGKGGGAVEDIKIAEGTQSKDFFHAAIANARKQFSVAERCKSFYQLHCFLQQWDPSAFEMDSRKIRVSRRGPSFEQRRKTSFLSGEDFDTKVVEQSLLAHECPRFPDELFGGKESVCCKRLRKMFGYVHNKK